MAAFTAVCAVIMLIITLSYISDFAHRLNLKTTSVGGKDGESCGSMEQKNVVWLSLNILPVDAEANVNLLGYSSFY